MWSRAKHTPSLIRLYSGLEYKTCHQNNKFNYSISSSLILSTMNIVKKIQITLLNCIKRGRNNTALSIFCTMFIHVLRKYYSAIWKAKIKDFIRLFKCFYMMSHFTKCINEKKNNYSKEVNYQYRTCSWNNIYNNLISWSSEYDNRAGNFSDRKPGVHIYTKLTFPRIVKLEQNKISRRQIKIHPSTISNNVCMMWIEITVFS